MDACQDVGIEQGVVGDDGDTAERLRLLEPAVAQRVEKQPAPEMRRAGLRPFERDRLEGRQQRLDRAPSQSSAAAAATTMPVSRSCPGDGLISMSSAKALRRQ